MERKEINVVEKVLNELISMPEWSFIERTYFNDDLLVTAHRGMREYKITFELYNRKTDGYDKVHEIVVRDGVISREQFFYIFCDVLERIITLRESREKEEKKEGDIDGE